MTERKYIDDFVDTNGPDGLEKLAKRCKVSKSLLEKIRAGYIPKKRWIRLQIAQALRVSEIKLFTGLKEGDL